MFGNFSNNAVDPSVQINRTGIKGRGRVKQVFDYPMCAHVWAAQSQEHGRSPKGQMYFHGKTIYSYGTHYPIARFTGATLNGQPVVLFNSEKNSSTTETHRGCVRNALNGLAVAVFHVPHVSESGVFGRNAHDSNIDALIERFNVFAKRAARAHVKLSWNEEANAPDNRVALLSDYAAPILDYCQAFNVTAPSIDIEGASKRIHDAFARYNDPKRVAARAKSQANKGLRAWTIAAQCAAFLERVTVKKPSLHFVGYRDKETIAAKLGFGAWQLERQLDIVERANAAHLRKPVKGAVNAAQWQAGLGAINGIEGASSDYVNTLLRRIGDRLQTSRGVEVPFGQAVIAFRKATQCRASGTAWHRNGERLPVGHFQVDSIDESGNIKAGCHTLQWPEVLRLAVQEVPEYVRPIYPLPAIIRA